jgi:hypothetical protein
MSFSNSQKSIWLSICYDHALEERALPTAGKNGSGSCALFSHGGNQDAITVALES